jgi:hypothetical protein
MDLRIPQEEGVVFPVERPFSGGIVFKKPQPRDYGFSDESEVQRIISEEEQRIEKIHRITFYSFFIPWLAATAIIWYILKVTYPGSGFDDGRLFWAGYQIRVFSAAGGLLFGWVCSFVARLLSERAFPPSAQYGKAKQYHDVNIMWKRRLQREYGYESH